MSGNLFLGKGNLFWGMQFRTCENFGESTDFSLVLSPKFSQIQKPHRHYFDCDSPCESTTNQAQNNKDSSLRWRIADSPEAIQKISQPNLARFVVQKIGIKDAVVPSADFLLESDKRGTPPKSEKRQLLARRGSGAGGAALLRKEKGESKGKEIIGDSQVAKMDSSLRMTNLVWIASGKALAMTIFLIFAIPQIAFAMTAFIYKSPAISRESHANPRHLRRI